MQGHGVELLPERVGNIIARIMSGVYSRASNSITPNWYEMLLVGFKKNEKESFLSL